MSLISIVYNYLPLKLQNAAVGIYGLYWKWRRFGGDFSDYVEDFKSRDFWNQSTWENHQKEGLKKLLKHAQKNVPFYIRKLKGLSVDFEKEKLNSILNSIPILEKDHLRLYGKNDLLAKNRKKGHFYPSSGSSGTPTSIYYSYDFHRMWSALFEARIRHWAGVNHKMSRGMIGGRRVLPSGCSSPPFYRYNAAEKQVYFSAYHIAPVHVKDYVKGIKHHEIEYMTGYAASNFILAKMIQEAGLQAPQLKAVITSSEQLTPEMRKLFEEVYGCKTYDSYSGVEACGLISECEHGSLHISPDSAIIEILDEAGRQVKPGETGEAVCTGLLNFDQPLIRYRIGDRLTLAENQHCACGRSMPIVSSIEGRIEDVLKGPDGREMVRFHGIFIDLPEIRRGQVVQESMDLFTVFVECGSPISELSKEKIIHRMRSQLGEVKVRVAQLDQIPLGPNGKFKAVVSKIK